MRLSIEFSFKDKLVLPIHYNHIVQGFIYKNISDNVFRSFLHDEGYKYEKRSFKLFTFSRIFGQFNMDKQSNTITYISPIKLIVSSILDDFINDFASTIIKSDNLFLGKTQVKFEKMEVFSHREIEEEILIKMLSPAVTYSTVDVYGKKKTIYHKPGDGVFSELAYKNLQKKFKSFYGKDAPECEFSITPVDEKKTKMISANYRGFIIKGWIGEFIMKGSKELIKLAYDTGLGSKNAQGFGCFEIINRKLQN